jgi:hypothetical protein
MSVNSTKRWAAAVLVVVTGLTGLWGLNLATAGRPGGGGATHTSTIVYSYQNAVYRMYEDGTGKTQVLPTGVAGIPSSKVYGGSRWWLTLADALGDGHAEIFAFREDGSPPVQLTACSPGGVYPGGNFQDPPSWSNDLQDTCVTINATADIEGDPTHHNYVIRLPIIGDIGWMESQGLLPLTAADCEFILPAKPPNPGDPGQFAETYPWIYTCSSDPSEVAYLVTNYRADGSTSGYTIWVRTLPDVPGDPPVDVPIYTAPKLKLYPFSWSHDGNRIAFYTYNTSTYGGTWTINPDGSGAVKVGSNSGTQNLYPNAWSPDSSELLLFTEKISIDISKYQYQLARMPAGGGRQTVLTGDLLATSQKSSAGKWFPLTP